MYHNPFPLRHFRESEIYIYPNTHHKLVPKRLANFGITNATNQYIQQTEKGHRTSL